MTGPCIETCKNCRQGFGSAVDWSEDDDVPVCIACASVMNVKGK